MQDDHNVRLGMILLAALGAIALIGSVVLQAIGVEAIDDFVLIASTVVGGLAGVLVGKNL